METLVVELLFAVCLFEEVFSVFHFPGEGQGECDTSEVLDFGHLLKTGDSVRSF